MESRAFSTGGGNPDDVARGKLLADVKEWN
jgi:hypothetical protein